MSLSVNMSITAKLIIVIAMRKRRTRRRRGDRIYEDASSGIFSSRKFFRSLKRHERCASLLLFLLSCGKWVRVTQKFRHAKVDVEYIFLQAELTRQSFSLLVGEKFFISRLRNNIIRDSQPFPTFGQFTFDIISICQKREQLLLKRRCI